MVRKESVPQLSKGEEKVLSNVVEGGAAVVNLSCKRGAVLDVVLILLNPVHLTFTLSYNPYVAVLTLDGHVNSLVEWGASLVKKSFQTGVDTSVVLCSAVLDRKPR